MDQVETRQRALDEDLKLWKEGLEKVEAAVKEAGEANGRNGKVVREWVKELEGRMERMEILPVISEVVDVLRLSARAVPITSGK